MREVAQKKATQPVAEPFFNTGNLRDLFLPELLYQIYEARQTGTLVFALGEFKKALVYDQGEVIFASSNLKEDSLGETMVRSGTISLTDFALAESKLSPN